MTQIDEELKNLSFEEAMQELETVVRSLESGKVKLEDAVSAYEKGMALKSICEAKLKTAKSKIDLLVIGQNNQIIETKDFDDDINK